MRDFAAPPGTDTAPSGDWTDTRARVEHYFDRTATEIWARLTSDEPVSRVRATVRAGRNKMRAAMLAQMPEDLSGARILDAGCGTGTMTQALAERGAEVVAVDISPSLVEIADRRLPEALRDQVTFSAGDLRASELGRFDHVLAMDSLIYYSADDIAATLDALAPRVGGAVIFTVAPRTPLLMTMWQIGRLFPTEDRSPVMHPHAPRHLARALRKTGQTGPLEELTRVSKGFYISTCLEFRP